MAFRLARCSPSLLATSLARTTTVASTFRNPFSRLPLRTMASAPEKHEWLVVVPDIPGTLAKRLEVRGAHLAGITPSREAGIVKFGGGIVNGIPPNTADPSTWDFAGSTLVVVAESHAEVVKLLEQDIYTKSGVWDIPKAQIYWLKTAFRDP